MPNTELRLGVYRESMATNPLLRKASLGKVMQRGFDLPGENFIYGRPNHCMDGGAQEAMQYCVLNEQKERAKLAQTNKSANIRRINYIKRNKFAVETGIVNAKEQAAAKKDLDQAYLIKPPSQKAKFSSAPTKISNDMAFGISTRPSTPVFELLEHHYQTKWLAGQQKKQMQKEEYDGKKAKESGKIRNTQANYQKQAKISLNLKNNESKQYKKDWQMSKWAKIEPKLQTFRSDRVKKDSMEYHHETQNTRQGIFGHGIYIE